MSNTNPSQIIPGQTTGVSIKAESHIRLKDAATAKTLYAAAVKRLIDVNSWHTISGTGSAGFQLVDAHGDELRRTAGKHDLIRIDIPGPGSKTGGGYDWVQIEEMENNSSESIDSAGFRVRPTRNPLEKSGGIAHFYSEESTSSFMVIRENDLVTAKVLDRNTKANTETGSVVDKVRNAVIGSGGIALFSKLQWNKLTDGLIAE